MLHQIQHIQYAHEKMGPFGTFLTKDPTINLLEKRLSDKLTEIMPKTPAPVPNSSVGVKIFSVEDAIKELLEMEKNK